MIDALDVVRHARARRMRLAVHPATGRVRLTLPRRASLAAGIAWAESQGAWIDRQRAKIPRQVALIDGAQFPFRGTQTAIRWLPDAPRMPALNDDAELICGGPAESRPGRVERWLRRQALDLLREETLETAMRAMVSVERVAVGDPRSRWGSCSASGTSRYSWRLILAPDFVRRATVAHEVAHRVHMNHGAAFHRLVEQLHEDDPTPARAWLRTHGATLHRIGGT